MYAPTIMHLQRTKPMCNQPTILWQALLVIMIEKFFLKIPRVAGKMERFYINIVEGKY